jgi:hypothetical protein
MSKIITVGRRQTTGALSMSGTIRVALGITGAVGVAWAVIRSGRSSNAVKVAVDTGTDVKVVDDMENVARRARPRPQWELEADSRGASVESGEHLAMLRTEKAPELLIEYSEDHMTSVPVDEPVSSPKQRQSTVTYKACEEPWSRRIRLDSGRIRRRLGSRNPDA